MIAHANGDAPPLHARQPSTRCVLIGEGSLAIYCAERLLACGFEVVGAYADDGSLRAWSDDHNVTCLTSRAEAHHFVQRSAVDLLFSVRNAWVLPETLLSTIRQATFNYHDSPLPRYAGMHATSWALLAGERDHGITWHAIEPRVGAGDIYQAVSVPIHVDDTALSLNTRCFEAAIAAFDRLTSELLDGTARGTPQATVARSYFGKYLRPRGACALPLAESAERCVDLVRALDFGPVTNPLGSPRLFGPRGVVYVGRARALPHVNAAPGSVLELRDDGTTVLATVAGALELSRCHDEHGKGLGRIELEQLGIRIGLPVSLPSVEQLDAITVRYAAAARQEAHWRVRLLELQCPSLPFARVYRQDDGPDAHTDAYAHAHVALSRLDVALSHFADTPSAAVPIVAAYLVRLFAGQPVDIATSTPEPDTPVGLFARFVPWRLDGFAELDRATYFDAVGASWQVHRARCPYPADLPIRNPTLRERIGSGREDSPNIALLCDADSWPEAELDRFDLAFIVTPTAVTVRYATNVLTREQVARIESQMICVLHAWHRNPRLRVSELPLLEPHEREQIIALGKGPHEEISSDASAHGLIAEQASATPNGLAVCSANHSLSFSELNEEASRLARVLVERGVLPGNRVGLCLRAGSPDAIVTMLAVLMTGCAYVPIDPEYPRARVECIVADAELTCVVCHRDTQSQFSISSTLVLDRDHPQWSARPSEFVPCATSPFDSAYIIYTSGTTGTPKGVEVPHRALVNHMHAMGRRIYGLVPGDRVLQSASLGFDIAGEQIWPALAAGAAVVVAPHNLLQTLHEFETFVARMSVTTLILPTSFWRKWVQRLYETRAKIPSQVRIVGVGTEAVSSAAYAAWRRVADPCVRWFQGYGPTEATITCTVFEPTRRDDLETIVPIGLPLSNIAVHVLDGCGEPVAPDCIGQVYVGGDGVAIGYRNRPDLTAERFVEDRLSEIQGARAYATGDLAYRNHDGHLVFVGRDDDQLKIRGFHVEPAEVESALVHAPGIREAIVVTSAPENGAAALVAYVRVSSDATMDSTKLSAFLRARLPEYMLPAAVIEVDEFPLTPHHKIDRRALACRPVQGAATTSSDATPPRDDIDLQVARILGDSLGTEVPGIDAGFFALGGDSLIAVRVLDAIRHTCQIDLPLADMFADPSVRGIADAIRRGGGRVCSRIIPLNDASEGAPLYLVCGLALYRELAASLADACPVFGVYLPKEEDILRGNGNTDRPAETPTVSWLANKYVDAIVAHYPQGSVAIGGVSFGGVVAYEVARLLEQRGRQVDLLVLVDAVLPTAVRVPTTVRLAQSLRQLGRRISELWPRSQPRADNNGERTNRAQVPGWHHDGRLAAYRDRLYRQAMVEFDSGNHEYEGDALLFCASEPVFGPRASIEPKRGWDRRIRGDLAVREARGAHLEILRAPAVRAVAADIRRGLATHGAEFDGRSSPISHAPRST